MKTLSIIMITRNAESVLRDSLYSIQGLWEELLIGDDLSKDHTINIAKSFGAKIFRSTGLDLGNRKQALIDKSKADWILVLDSDERLSEPLFNEIRKLLKNDVKRVNGYRISYQNFVFGSPVNYGGEHYSKIRLFRRGFARIDSSILHEEIRLLGTEGRLKGVILHYSYRTLLQVIRKFTKYALLASIQKYNSKEEISFSKLFFYAPHMFISRFLFDQGWCDGWRGFVLASLFSYMEGLTYWLLLYRKLINI